MARVLAQPVTYLGVAMLAFLYCAVAYLLVADRQDDFKDAVRDGENLIGIFDQSFSSIFKSVDATLLFIRKSYQQNPTTFDLTAWVNDPSIRNKLTFSFTILDPNGRIVDNSYSKSLNGSDRSNLEIFRVQANSSEDQLFIGKPFTLPMTGRPTVALTRRMTAPDGSFAGIVVAHLDPAELGNNIAKVDLGPGGAFALVSFDGYMYTRVADGKMVPGSIGQKLPPQTNVLKYVGPNKAGHYWNTPGVIDPVSRLISYRSVESFPLTAVVGVAEAEVYRHSNENARIYLAIALLLTPAILFAIYSGAMRERKLIETTAQMRQAKDALACANQELESRVEQRTADLECEVHQRKQAQIALARSQERYALVEDAVNDGIFDRNLVTDEVYLSPRWKRILGYADDEIPDVISSFFDRIHPDDKAAYAEAARTHLEDNKPHDLELRLRCKNGDYRWVHSRGKAVRDAANRPVRMVGTISDISERKQAEALIEESRSNLARAETMALLGHYKFENATKKLTWSEGVYRILGKSPASFTPTLSNALEPYHPDDRLALKQYHLDVIAGVKVPSKVLRAVKPDGQKIYVEFWSTPIRASDGTVTGMFGTLQDVTARKQAEVLIDESRSNLARAEAMARLGHVRFDKESGEYTWSDGVYRIMGRSPESFTPTLSNSVELIYPDDRPALEQFRRDALAGLEVPRTTLRAIRADGQMIFVEFWSTSIRASDGSVTGLFATIQDVTARNKARALIEENRNNLARAETMALMGHYKYEPATDTLAWSDGLYRILGKSPESFTPTLSNALELYHPDDRPMLEKHRREVFAGNEPPRMVLRAVRDDGQIKKIEFWSAPIRASDGTVTGIFGTVQDVTERKQAEAVLAQANHELEARVAERTAELAQEMRRREEAQMTLAQAQKMEAIGQLTAGIAHDFNNLLAVIRGSLGFVEEAAMRGLTAEPELVDAAMRATRRGSDLVQRLLAFARQSPLKAEPTAIDQLVLDTLRLLKRTLGPGIDIVTQLDAAAAAVRVDRNQLVNALLNLALNARDAMPEGGQLTITTLCQASQWAAVEGAARWPTGEEVCIIINDTGIGMTEDVRNRVYEPFFTTKADGLGSGLGLSMVQGFVAQSGGHIDIDSTPGSGTTITVRLPRIAAPGQTDETSAAAGISAGDREKTILLVEDDPDVRIITAAQLKQLGYKVHAVANGMEAIDLIESPADIDITLTDIVLPGRLDGVALVKEAMRSRPRMGVLCMSGYGPTQMHRKWLEVQNIQLLEKPFSSTRLAQALDDALAQ